MTALALDELAALISELHAMSAHLPHEANIRVEACLPKLSALAALTVSADTSEPAAYMWRHPEYNGGEWVHCGPDSAAMSGCEVRSLYAHPPRVGAAGPPDAGALLDDEDLLREMASAIHAEWCHDEVAQDCWYADQPCVTSARAALSVVREHFRSASAEAPGNAKCKPSAETLHSPAEISSFPAPGSEETSRG